jgi:hypothetical protein
MHTNQKDCEEIKNLKRQVRKLIKISKKLMKRYDLQIKQNKPAQLESFLQQHEHDVNNLRDKIENNKQIVKGAILEKKDEIKKLFNLEVSKYGKLINQINSIEKKVEDSKHRQTNFLKTFERKIDSQTINTEFLNSKEAKLDTIYSNDINVEGLEINDSGITIKNGDYKLVSGYKEVTVSELFDGFKSFQALTDICGKKFEKCKPLSETILNSEAEKQNKILDNLRKLKHEANSIIDQNKKLRNR